MDSKKKIGCGNETDSAKSEKGGLRDGKRVSGGYRLEGKATVKHFPFDKTRLVCTVNSPFQDLVGWNTIVGELVRLGYPREDVEKLTRDLCIVLLGYLKKFKRVDVMRLFTLAPKMSLKKTMKAGGNIEQFIEEIRNVKAADVDFGFVVRFLPPIKDIAQGFKGLDLSITDIDFADDESDEPAEK